MDKKNWTKPQISKLGAECTKTDLVEGMPCPDCGGEWIWDVETIGRSSNGTSNGGGGHHNHKPGCGHKPQMS